MKIRHVIESLTDWGADWVHFTKHPMLTINPRSLHQDPSGIYFFPASVIPEAEMWRTMPYKFTINLKPDARVLDVSKVTEQQIYQMIDAAGIREQLNALTQQYPPADTVKLFDMAWSELQRYFGFGMGKPRQYAAFNTMLRSLGWQAIFDDTGSIHVGEPQQLLVLDPRVMTNIRMEQKSGGGFAAMQKVVQEVQAVAHAYGNVEATPIKKPNAQTYYADRDNLLMCTINITNPRDEQNYVSILVSIRKDYPDRVSASIRYSNPSLGYGSGIEYSISKQTYLWHKGIEGLRDDFDRIFQPQNPVAETKKLPGPRVAGSGKDFRQDAGTNRSGKQPGRLMGSGKQLKVKPGFVG